MPEEMDRMSPEKRLVEKSSAKQMVQIVSNSLTMELSPYLLMKLIGFMGEAWIGRKGKKYRVLSKGANIAMPLPPNVAISKMPCVAVNAVK